MNRMSLPPFRKALFPLLMVLSVSTARAQYTTQTIRDYIAEWWPVAVREMQESGIPASISLAQGILESAAGTSELASRSNNHFGIKCHKGWTGKTVHYDDDAPNECFRRYNSPEDSWEDHSEFLRTRDRYASLFDLKSDDYKGWAHGLKKAGYATNPKYPELLIKLINDYNLDQYDQYNAEQLAAEGGGRRRKPGAPDTPGPAISAEVFWFNRIPTVLASAGEHPIDIAERHFVPLLRLCDYNDFEPEYVLSTGEKVFLKPKRRKAADKVHIVKGGESLRDIAQDHGVRLDLLARRNLVTEGFIPAAGERIELRGKANRPPKAAPRPSPKPANTAVARSTTKPAAGQPILEERSNPTAHQPLPVESRAVETPVPDPVPPVVNTADRPAELALPLSERLHEVLQGETLYSISRRYQVSVDQLRLWNSLPDNNIRIGQQLMVRQ